MTSSDTEITQLVYFSNKTDREITLLLEPWGELVLMKPKTQQGVLVGGLFNERTLRVEVENDHIIVSAFDGNTLLLVSDDT